MRFIWSFLVVLLVNAPVSLAGSQPETEWPPSRKLPRALRLALDQYERHKASAKPNTHPWRFLTDGEQELIVGFQYDLLKEADMLSPFGRLQFRDKTPEDLPIALAEARAFYRRVYALYGTRARARGLSPYEYLVRIQQTAPQKPERSSVAFGRSPAEQAAPVQAEFPAIEMVMAIAKYDALKATLSEDEAWDQLDPVEQKWILLHHMQVLVKSDYPRHPAYRLVQTTEESLKAYYILLPASEVQKLYGRSVETVPGAFAALEQIALGMDPVPWQRGSPIGSRTVGCIGVSSWGLNLETLHEEVFSGIFLSRLKRDYLMAQIHFLFQKGLYPSSENLQGLLHHRYPFRISSLMARARAVFGSYEQAFRRAGFPGANQCLELF